jgi:hypothetical protein
MYGSEEDDDARRREPTEQREEAVIAAAQRYQLATPALGSGDIYLYLSIYLSISFFFSKIYIYPSIHPPTFPPHTYLKDRSKAVQRFCGKSIYRKLAYTVMEL